MDIWLGLGLSVTDRVIVRHTPEIFVALFTSTDTRPIYKAWRCSNSLVWVRVRITVTIMASIRVP